MAFAAYLQQTNTEWIFLRLKHFLDLDLAQDSRIVGAVRTIWSLAKARKVGLTLSYLLIQNTDLLL